MSTSRNKSGSSGLRILWIPGRKHSPKGHLGSTNKRVNYSGQQKKSEVWSLGGSKVQKELIDAEPGLSLLESPLDTNRLAPVTYAVGAAAAAAAVSEIPENKQTIDSPLHAPCTPNSTTSTAPLLSSPQTYSSVESGDETQMKDDETPPVVQTITAQIVDQNRFSVLDKEPSEGEGNTYEIPVIHSSSHHHPHHLEHQCDTLPLNNSSGTNGSTATTSPSLSSKSNAKNNMEIYNNSPSRKKHYRNHNNNQGDVNSIESVADDEKPSSDNLRKIVLPNKELFFLDELLSDEKSDFDRDDKDDIISSNPAAATAATSAALAAASANAKRKKKKKQSSTKTKDLDQLDGVAFQKSTQQDLMKQHLQRQNNEKNNDSDDEDDRMVKCLYYTLMCCDCAIS